MKQVTIIVPGGDGNNLSSLVGAFKILTRAEEYWRQQGRAGVLQIQLAGITDTVSFHEGLFNVTPHTHISDCRHTDLIIIPSLNHAYREVVEQNQALIDWLIYQYKQGAEIATIC